MKHKILYLNPSSQLGGAEKSLLDLLGHLNKERYYPIISCPGEGKFVEELRKIGVEIVVIPYDRRILNLSRSENSHHLLTLAQSFWWLKPTILGLRKLVKDEAVDLIVTNGIKCHFIGSFLSLITNVRLIWHVRDFIDTLWLQWMIRSMGHVFPDKIITNSHAVRNIFSRNGKTQTVYNGIDLSLFDPGTDGERVRTMLNISKETKLIGTVGHLAPLKGYEELMEAMGKVVREGFDVKLVVVGDAIYPHSQRYKRKLLSLVESNGLNDRVIFAGHREDIPELLASFDIFVLPSQSEGFGRVNLEAMAMGKPVISTNVGGIPEVVVDGVTGILVPPDDPNALSRALMKLLDDPSQRESMGREGRKRVEERFTLQGHVQRIQLIYRDVLRTP